MPNVSKGRLIFVKGSSLSLVCWFWNGLSATSRHVVLLYALVICKRGNGKGDRHGHFAPVRSVVGEQGFEKFVLKKEKKERLEGDWGEREEMGEKKKLRKMREV